MLIGFIVVIVMILVIVGLMATGNTGGGTGINQTKATKVVTEIGTIAQSLSFFKTTTAAGDMSGFTNADGTALLDGYDINGDTVSTDLKYAFDDANAGTTPDGLLANNQTDTLARSQAVPSVVYGFEVGAINDTNGSLDTSKTDSFVIDIVLAKNNDGVAIDSDLADVIGDTVKSKLTAGNMKVAGYGPTTSTGVADPYTENSVLRITVK